MNMENEMRKLVIATMCLMIACATEATPPPAIGVVAHCQTGDDGCVEHPIPHPGWRTINDVYQDAVTPESQPSCQTTGLGSRCLERVRWEHESGSYECTVDFWGESGEVIVVTCTVGPDLTSPSA
jgi:hypothetical protein